MVSERIQFDCSQKDLSRILGSTNALKGIPLLNQQGQHSYRILQITQLYTNQAHLTNKQLPKSNSLLKKKTFFGL